MKKSRKLTILFAGMIAADPNQGGATWAVLQYLLGFRRLGHEVIFVEPIKASALRANGSSFESSENARYFQETIREFGLDQQAALLLTETRKTVGLTYQELTQKAARADGFDLQRTKTKSCSGGRAL